MALSLGTCSTAGQAVYFGNVVLGRREAVGFRRFRCVGLDGTMASQRAKGLLGVGWMTLQVFVLLRERQHAGYKYNNPRVVGADRDGDTEREHDARYAGGCISGKHVEIHPVPEAQGRLSCGAIQRYSSAELGARGCTRTVGLVVCHKL